MSSFSPGLANLAQASRAMTQAVAPWAMHMSRAWSAKVSLACSSARLSGQNMSGPSGPTIKSAGVTRPVPCMH